MKFERKILQDLYKSVDGLFAFTLYSRYGITAEQTFNFIEKYEKKGVLVFSNDKLTLTKEGRDIILKQMFKTKSGTSKFDNIPNEFKGSKIEINQPFLPNINTISAEILKD